MSCTMWLLPYSSRGKPGRDLSGDPPGQPVDDRRTTWPVGDGVDVGAEVGQLAGAGSVAGAGCSLGPSWTRSMANCGCSTAGRQRFQCQRGARRGRSNSVMSNSDWAGQRRRYDSRLCGSGRSPARLFVIAAGNNAGRRAAERNADRVRGLVGMVGARLLWGCSSTTSSHTMRSGPTSRVGKSAEDAVQTRTWSPRGSATSC